MRHICFSIIAIVSIFMVLIFTKLASAALIWDYSPATLNAAPVFPYSTDSWSNLSSGRNFAGEFITLPTATYLTGIDIYSNNNFGSVGQDVTVKLWSFYDRTLITEIQTIITTIDNDGAIGDMSRKHADINPLLLPADTWFWIGMSGTNIQLAQAGLTRDNPIPYGEMLSVDGTVCEGRVNNNTMAFRLYGTSNNSPVPIPSPLMLLGAGFVSIACLRGRTQYILSNSKN